MFKNFNKKVVITGIGCISPIGNNIKKMWNSLINGKIGINKIKKFNNLDLPIKIAGEIKSFNINKYLNKNDSIRMDKFLHYGIAASLQAINDSKINYEYKNLNKIGIIIGTGIGNLSIIEKTFKKIIYKNIKNINPFFISSTIINIISGYLSIKYGFTGPNLSISTSCATSTYCISTAYNMIKNNNADIVITGGSESIITPLGISGFLSSNILSNFKNPKNASRPFDKNRNGFVLSEGSGIIILENYNNALKRKSKIYSEISGYGISNSINHIIKPDLYGPINCIYNSLKKSKKNINEIQCINAHATSTKIGDKNETNIIKLIFKNYSYKLIVNASKSSIGHLLGASGVLESIISILSLHYQIIPPTNNIYNQDPECDLDYCKIKYRKIKIKNILKNSFGFGGSNISIIFSKI
ncbi:putative 3-oxoacyl-(acyl carrier protein) synthase II [Candidatus Zinderia insecticola CARI]|uniref:3-oxoacyl-[acyl-carrier-protein] synthase 2 n=1 Tax=Zinderia insecticola (strain CARI) TaxID=871271 RepID=E0TIW9_ZINIC|nr:putative 3-oxoacyl-(acyl carrier protein) synthase II [Candidatus Zinderia insecticola CARI]